MNRRNTVLWVADVVPDEYKGIAEVLGLSFVPTGPDEVQPARQNPLAVVLPMQGVVEGKFRGRLARTAAPCLDSGALLVILAESAAHFEAASMMVQHLSDGLKIDLTNVRLIRNDRIELARHLRDFDPGPAVDQTIKITGKAKTADEAESNLLRRAFNGFDKIFLEPMFGGRSPESKVWKVRGFKGERCCEPFVVKAGRRRFLVQEQEVWRGFVADYIPFPFRAPPVPAMFVAGASKALLVSMLAGRSHRFDEYVTAVKGPELAVAALFDGALRNWRRDPTPLRTERLGRILLDESEIGERDRATHDLRGLISKALLPAPVRLAGAYKLARKSAPATPTPDQLYEAIGSLPAIEYRECYMHGDLNARNLFVRWNGVDIILIDFSHAVGTAPMSRDPSRLEVSIAFDVADGDKTFLSDRLLRALYRPPLLPPKQIARGEDGRTHAIRQLRIHAGGEGINNLEYALMTASHLLRYARGGSNTATEVSKKDEPRLRRLAYLLAVDLINWMREVLLPK